MSTKLLSAIITCVIMLFVIGAFMNENAAKAFEVFTITIAAMGVSTVIYVCINEFINHLKGE